VTLVRVDAPLRGEMPVWVAFAESEEKEAVRNTWRGRDLIQPFSETVMPVMMASRDYVAP
jgi:hypothetical protein